MSGKESDMGLAIKGEGLELYDVIDEISTDLCYGCVLNKSGNYNDPEWVRKYVDCQRICR
ncbi:MAG: hypothetical protein SOX82_12470 [Eubacteriales bacterium]|nr:hypothetical protein [Eubacteriales bacterium]